MPNAATNDQRNMLADAMAQAASITGITEWPGIMTASHARGRLANKIILRQPLTQRIGSRKRRFR
jgi:hypothetical protein